MIKLYRWQSQCSFFYNTEHKFSRCLSLLRWDVELGTLLIRGVPGSLWHFLHSQACYPECWQSLRVTRVPCWCQRRLRRDQDKYWNSSMETVSTCRRCWLWAVRTWAPNSRAGQILCCLEATITGEIRPSTELALLWWRGGSDGLWSSVPTVQGDCLGKMNWNAGIMEDTKRLRFKKA